MFVAGFGFGSAGAAAAFGGFVAVDLLEEGLAAVGDAAADDAEMAAFAGFGAALPIDGGFEQPDGLQACRREMHPGDQEVAEVAGGFCQGCHVRDYRSLGGLGYNFGMPAIGLAIFAVVGGLLVFRFSGRSMIGLLSAAGGKIIEFREWLKWVDDQFRSGSAEREESPSATILLSGSRRFCRFGGGDLWFGENETATHRNAIEGEIDHLVRHISAAQEIPRLGILENDEFGELDEFLRAQPLHQQVADEAHVFPMIRSHPRHVDHQIPQADPLDGQEQPDERIFREFAERLRENFCELFHERVYSALTRVLADSTICLASCGVQFPTGL